MFYVAIIIFVDGLYTLINIVLIFYLRSSILYHINVIIISNVQTQIDEEILWTRIKNCLCYYIHRNAYVYYPKLPKIEIMIFVQLKIYK